MTPLRLLSLAALAALICVCARASAQEDCSVHNSNETACGISHCYSDTSAACVWDGKTCACPTIIITTTGVAGCPQHDGNEVFCNRAVCPDTSVSCVYDNISRHCFCPADAATTGAGTGDDGCRRDLPFADCSKSVCTATNQKCSFSDATGCACPASNATTTGNSVPVGCSAYDGNADLCNRAVCPDDKLVSCVYDTVFRHCSCPADAATTGAGTGGDGCPRDLPFADCSKSVCTATNQKCSFSDVTGCACPTSSATTTGNLVPVGCSAHDGNADLCNRAVCPDDKLVSCVYDTVFRHCSCPADAATTGAGGDGCPHDLPFADCSKSVCTASGEKCSFTDAMGCFCPSASTATTGAGCIPTVRCQPESCGSIDNGCGELLNCGSCTDFANSYCNASSNTCTCLAATCDSLGYTCGPTKEENVTDGCGQAIRPNSCGTCNTSTSSCVDGNCQPQDCNATTSCAAENRICGTLTIGPAPCANVSCGLCSFPNTCTAQGQCTCTPTATCQGSCGFVDLGCGLVDCGSCASGTCEVGNTCSGASTSGSSGGSSTSSSTRTTGSTGNSTSPSAATAMRFQLGAVVAALFMLSACVAL